MVLESIQSWAAERALQAEGRPQMRKPLPILWHYGATEAAPFQNKKLKPEFFFLPPGKILDPACAVRIGKHVLRPSTAHAWGGLK
jgi:hypothetical protein